MFFFFREREMHDTKFARNKKMDENVRSQFCLRLDLPVTKTLSLEDF